MPGLSDNRTCGFWPDFHFSDYGVYEDLGSVWKFACNEGERSMNSVVPLRSSELSSLDPKLAQSPQSSL
jgi:hypothetical protein